MKIVKGLMACAFASVLVFASGCGGKTAKCEKLFTKTTEMAVEMAKAFGGGDKVDEMKKELESKKGEFMAECEKANEADIDCVINAKDLEEASKCKPISEKK